MPLGMPISSPNRLSRRVKFLIVGLNRGHAGASMALSGSLLSTVGTGALVPTLCVENP
jgi:hypothetical protein